MECRVVIVHHDPIVRAGLRALVQQRLHARSVVTVGSLPDAAGLLDQRPALVLVENTPQGLAGLRTLLDHTAARVVVISHTDDAAALQAGVLAGIKGFCVYDGAHVEGLLDVVARVAAGEYAFDPVSMRHLVADCRAAWRSNGEGAVTAEELTVFRYVAAGAGTREIAAALSISPATVRSRAAKVMHKLGVRTRLAAVTKLIAGGLLSPAPPAAPRDPHAS
ncbi:MAG: response regulator transcription factor [Armatimonadota bacterium]|nr:response regulator transcription factor [Armatimonadota bacterium]